MLLNRCGNKTVEESHINLLFNLSALLFCNEKNDCENVAIE